MEKERNIVYFKWGDMFAGFTCLLFAIGSFVPRPVYWFGAIFFGLGFFVLLFKYVSPRNRVLRRDSEEARLLRRHTAESLFETDGMFDFYDDGFGIFFDDSDREYLWEEIAEVNAYRKNLGETFVICLEILTGNPVKDFTITENIPGWYQFEINLRQHLPGICEGWYTSVASDADGNKLNLYTKPCM